MYGLPTDSPAIKQVAFIEKFRAFGKEGPVFIVTYFKRREVQHLVVTLHLPEVGDQRHVHRKTITDSVFHIHAPVYRAVPFGARCLWIMGKIGGEIGRKRKPYRWFNIGDVVEVA